MSHVWMNHVTHTNESWMRAWVIPNIRMSYIWMSHMWHHSSFITWECVKSHICAWDMAHICRSHATCIKQGCRTFGWVTHVDEWYHRVTTSYTCLHTLELHTYIRIIHMYSSYTHIFELHAYNRVIHIYQRYTCVALRVTRVYIH